MRKAILIMLLAGVSSNAAAEWVEVGSSEKTTVYVDPATIRRAGNLVKMWNLIDLKTATLTAGSKPYTSQMTQAEFDCKEEQWRRLYFSWHSGNMTRGEIVYSDSNPGTWEPVPPGSATEVLWKFACGKW